MAAGSPVLPREAMAFLRAKGLRPSSHWLSVWREEHASAFTVAQMTGQDLLRQTHRALERALRRGETLDTFRKRLLPFLRKKGWVPKGRGGNVPARLRRVYDTNLRTAHAAGHWNRIHRRRDLLPWLVYALGPSEEHREQHALWAGLCLRVDDPWWRTHYPPNGWGCKCHVRQVAEPPKGARTKAPPIETRPWTNPATKQTVHVPEGIDPGWDYNAADHAGLGTAQALTDRLQRLTTPSAGGRARRGTVLELARRTVERHVEGPGFAWFVDRGRGEQPPVKRRRHIDYGRLDKAAPVAVLPDALAERLEAATAIVTLTDWAAGKQFWKHGLGRQMPQRSRGLAVEVPVEWYAEIQELVDDTVPQRHGNEWAFLRTDGRRLVVRVRDGVTEVLAYY